MGKMISLSLGRAARLFWGSFAMTHDEPFAVIVIIIMIIALHKKSREREREVGALG